MLDYTYLAYIPDPFGVDASAFSFMDRDGNIRYLSRADVAGLPGDVVTYNITELIDDLGQCDCRTPANITDVADALRLLAGVPKDEGGEKLWGLWENYRPHFASSDEATRFEALVYARVDRPESSTVEALLAAAVLALKALWVDVQARLALSEELERFVSIEVPIRRIFATRQALGLLIDRTLASSFLRQVEDTKFLAFAAVAEALGRAPIDIGFWNVQSLLHSTDLPDLASESNGGRLKELFKIAANHSEFAKQFLRFTDAERDARVLKRMLSQSGFHPSFQTLGTVTGRILVSDPHVQQLKRTYRQVVLPDEGMKLTYLDFKQFEPGVLAFLSGDTDLVAAYNSGDLYEALSAVIFGGSDHRQISKRIFLAYSYGMTPDRISRLLLGTGAPAANAASLVDGIERFFGSFPGLSRFREVAVATLRSSGFVGSLFGNRRVRIHEGELTPKERRWALNQMVQSTASLIFKEATMAVCGEFGSASVLIPMHDALLLQFPDDASFDSSVRRASDLMTSAFAARCPGVEAKIARSEFHE